MPAAPVHRQSERLTSLLKALERQLASLDASGIEALDLIVWYLQRAASMGFSCDVLPSALSDRPHLQAVVADVIKGELLHLRPPPAFLPGEAVEVILNERNRTYRNGRVVRPVWHHKDRHWYFFLRNDGKTFKKCYCAEDLRPLCDSSRMA